MTLFNINLVRIKYIICINIKRIEIAIHSSCEDVLLRIYLGAPCNCFDQQLKITRLLENI
jgi:hypothetical protein